MSRRSGRVTLRVPLQIYEPGTDKRFHIENAHSVKVSLWGGLVALQSAVEQGQKLLLVNQATGETKESHVVYLGPTQLDKRRLVGIGFLEPASGFWGIGFISAGQRHQPTTKRYYA